MRVLLLPTKPLVLLPAMCSPPTAPSGLTVTGTTRSTVSLSWTASTDNVGVTSYDIYVNGLKTYSTTGTSFVVDNLSYGKTYTFAVTARDFAKNISPFSNQVVGQALSTGWHYNYFTGDVECASQL